MSDGDFVFRTEPVAPERKRILRYDPKCLEHPYEGYEGGKRLEAMAAREGLILLPVRTGGSFDVGMPAVLAEGGGFPGTLRDWFAGMALQGMLAYNSDGDAYDPGLRDDEVEAEKDLRHGVVKTGGVWVGSSMYGHGGHDEKANPTHRVVASYERRLARCAYELADMMAERGAKP